MSVNRLKTSFFPSWEETIQKILDQWSVPFLFPHQQLCIHYLLSANKYFSEECEEDAGLLASLPTGSGKSLCFMAAAGLLDGLSIILYPLNALLRDQKRRFEASGVSTLVYYGGLGENERQTALKNIEKLYRGVILTNIESAISQRFQRHIQGKNIKLLVIDEGHLIIQWGKSFRPRLLKIGELRKTLGYPVTGVFTATITHEDRKELGTLLWPNEGWEYFEMLSDRTNIRYRIVPSVDPLTTLRLLLRQACDDSFNLLAVHPELKRELHFPMLVFVPRRQDCERFARHAEIWLRLWGKIGIEIWYYHAGMDSEERKTIEKDFAGCNSGLLFTTKAFGTGVDIAGIRSSIHVHEPDTMEDFLQESGRTGRDGKDAFSYIIQKEPSLFTENGCRRKQALRALGQEAPICSGCDYCEGIQWKESVEQTAIKELKKINKLELKIRDEFRLLHYEDFASMDIKSYLDIGKN